MYRLKAKIFTLSLLAVNWLVIVYFWSSANLVGMIDGSTSLALGVGRLFGLTATLLVLLQFVLMSRANWLEPIWGLDRIAKFHKYNGFTAISLALAHPFLIILGYSSHTGLNLIDQFFAIKDNFPYVDLAGIGITLLAFVVVFSIAIVMRKMKFEIWYSVHILTYIAVTLLPMHQLTNGASLLYSEAFGYYWIALYLFAACNVLIWRFSKPFISFLHHGYYVDEVVPEGERATSIYIKGNDLGGLNIKGGQFVFVRFLTGRLWRQEHPFSVSALPGDRLRLTIRKSGDFTTEEVPNIKPGTKVSIGGPFGAFILKKARSNKLLMIAGGIGITPIASMLQQIESAHSDENIVLLYGNANQSDIPLRHELEKRASAIGAKIHHVLSDDPHFAGEKGFVDGEKIQRLVPDFAQRDIFLCGPPMMMGAVIRDLEKLGVDKSKIHYEVFNLHVKRFKG